MSGRLLNEWKVNLYRSFKAFFKTRMLLIDARNFQTHLLNNKHILISEKKNLGGGGLEPQKCGFFSGNLRIGSDGF